MWLLDDYRRSGNLCCSLELRYIFAMQQQFLSNLFEIVNRLYPYGLIITEGGSEDD